jgi:hypothetical protein
LEALHAGVVKDTQGTAESISQFGLEVLGDGLTIPARNVAAAGAGDIKKLSTIEWASVKKVSTIAEASISKVSTIDAN